MIRQHASGRWEAKLRGKSTYHPTREDAEAYLDQLLLEFDTPAPTQHAHQSLKEWLDAYLRSRAPELGDGTLAKYEWHVSLIAKHELAHMPLHAIRPRHIEGFLQVLARNHSKAYLQGIAGLLKRALRRAVRYEIFPSNPAESVELPRVRTKRTSRALEPHEVRALLKVKVAEGSKWHVFLLLALTLGLRHSELLGLQWRDVDWEDGTMTIRRGVVQSRNKTVVRETLKTAGAERTLYLPDSTKHALLLAYRERDRGSRWVFPNEEGGPLNQANVRRAYRRLLKEAKLPHARIHDLRITYGTMLIAEGEDPRTVADLLGHARTDTTMEWYTRSVREKRKRGAKYDAHALYGAE